MNNNIVGITQCAVSPYDSFQYNFTVNEAPGTYWYHTHSGHLGIEGYNAIKGPLIVHEKRPLHLNETGFFKGFDAKASDTSLLSYNNERILFFSDGFLLSDSSLYMNKVGGLNPPASKNEDGFPVGTVNYDFGTCNGKLREIVNVFTGETYKLRIINGGSHYAFRISIDGFVMTVVAADSEQVEAHEVDEIILHAGERFDVEVSIPVDLKGDEQFWIRADTLESTKQGYQVCFNY